MAGDGAERSLKLVPLTVGEEGCFCQDAQSVGTAHTTSQEGDGGEDNHTQARPIRTGKHKIRKRRLHKLPTRMRQFLRRVTSKCSHLVLHRDREEPIAEQSLK